MDNPCLSCGVCCMSYRVAFHWSETTAHPDGRVPVELTEPLRLHEVAMRGTMAAPLRCIALAGVPGERVSCAIHGTHPTCCREVALGDDQCNRARLAHGLAPLPAEVIVSAYASDDPPALPPTHPLAAAPGPAQIVLSGPAPAGDPGSDIQPSHSLARLALPVPRQHEEVRRPPGPDAEENA